MRYNTTICICANIYTFIINIIIVIKDINTQSWHFSHNNSNIKIISATSHPRINWLYDNWNILWLMLNTSTTAYPCFSATIKILLRLITPRVKNKKGNKVTVRKPVVSFTQRLGHFHDLHSDARVFHQRFYLLPDPLLFIPVYNFSRPVTR